jgi:hypothetical protein
MVTFSCKPRKLARIAIAPLSFLALIHPAFAVGVPSPPIAKQVSEAELVVIGKSAKTIRMSGARGLPVTYAMLKDIMVVKGQPPSQIWVLVRSEVPELDPRCCKKGKPYLFILKSDGQGRFYAPYGKNSVRAI